MTDLATLIAKLEAAEAGSRELDAEIVMALRGKIPDAISTPNLYPNTLLYRNDEIAPGALEWVNVPGYTASIDAALTLVPEGWVWKCQDKPAVACVADSKWAQKEIYQLKGISSTPALALCIAALRARATAG
jgi:hypothetical protein